MPFALITPTGTVLAVDSSMTSEEMREIVGGWLEEVNFLSEGVALSCYVNDEARLRGNVARNLVASLLMGQELLGPVLVVGAYDTKAEADTDLTDAQWELIHDAAAAAEALA